MMLKQIEGKLAAENAEQYSKAWYLEYAWTFKSAPSVANAIRFGNPKHKNSMQQLASLNVRKQTTRVRDNFKPAGLVIRQIFSGYLKVIWSRVLEGY